MDAIIPFKQTDLPELVEPATRRWGIFARSAYLCFPATSLPRAMVSLLGEFQNSGVSMDSLKLTTDGLELGTSTPIAALPGMGASTRTSIAARDIARLSARETILLTLIPGAT